MRTDVAEKRQESEYKNLAGPSVQPSSFVVFSSRLSSLSKSLWSLLAIVFLLLSSFFAFIWTGDGFTGYKQRKENVKKKIISMLQLT